ncbi:MAG: TetR/AcrR family transcriptional regulator [Ilumatobacter sp.]
MASPSGRPIRTEVLELAESTIQRVGVNGFSYGDLARELGIKAPSIHHHFATKDELVAEVAERYRAAFAERVGDIATTDPHAAIRAFADLFVHTAQAERMCLCGSMSADWASVGERSRRTVARFFDDQRTWLCERLDGAVGIGAGAEIGALDSDEAAMLLLATLEGAVLLSRAGEDPALARRLIDAQLRIWSPQATTG